MMINALTTEVVDIQKSKCCSEIAPNRYTKSQIICFFFKDEFIQGDYCDKTNKSIILLLLKPLFVLI